MKVFLALLVAAAVIAGGWLISLQPWADEATIIGYAVTAIVGSIVGSALTGLWAALTAQRAPRPPSNGDRSMRDAVASRSPVIVTVGDTPPLVSGISRVLGVVAVLLVFATVGAVLGSLAFGEIPLDGITGQQGTPDTVSGALGAAFGMILWAFLLSGLGGWAISALTDDDDGGLVIGWIGCGVAAFVGFFLPLLT
ncbi:hypothetical protein [Microbacterium sp. RU33B]|uniref:hypothetical protein n=1 Tax=Microbacterium sp. RU33B TaxID=1907390 RepID=UPI00095D7F7E|nr:hypothetical protein [Microbacterium sp. RU33B]SIT72581.1 hypothetical protein SAMN05880545_1076 [Microbacterium sp. RU33B]